MFSAGIIRRMATTAMNKLVNEYSNSVRRVVNDPRWARIVARDKTADGHLWYSVSTTGVYCRPSCPSRTANPENVTLHGTLESARATGFRPCKRCNPEGRSPEGESTALVTKACRIIEESEEERSLEVLAEDVGRSPSYFHRLFKAATGLTPKDYAAAKGAPRRGAVRPPNSQWRSSARFTRATWNTIILAAAVTVSFMTPYCTRRPISRPSLALSVSNSQAAATYRAKSSPGVIAPDKSAATS